METSQVSIFAVHVQPNELRSRMQMTDIVNRRKMRHAHMVNINRQIMLEGMRADFAEGRSPQPKVIDIVTTAQRDSRDDAGRQRFRRARSNPNYKWLKTSGIISPDKWGNLPGGEVFTTPGEVNGTFVIDGVVGDYLCDKYGDLEATPLTFGSRTTGSSTRVSANKELERSSGRYTHTDENSDRVGEFAIGTNIELTRRDRQHPAGREDPRHPHRLRQSLRRAHRRRLVFVHAHRRRRPRLRHLGGWGTNDA